MAGHDGYLREVNEAFAALLGLSCAQVNGRSLLELVHPEDVAAVVVALAALERGTGEVILENRFRQGDTGWVHLQWVARPVPGTDLWWALGRDTTEFHRLLADRVNLRAQLDLALGTSTAAMWELDIRQGLFSWEAQAASILGRPPAEVPGSVAELAAAVHPDDAGAVLAALKALDDSGETEVGLRFGQDAALRHVCLRGKVLDRDHRGRPRRAVGLLLDVTTEKAMEEQMLRMVMTDALTGVPNRRSFDQTLRAEWRRCRRALVPLSVLMVDIDDFKAFNDDFGHLVGDEALCAVARALSSELHRKSDVVARFGGEEFAVVLPGTDATDALKVAQRLVEAVRGVVVRQAGGRSLTVSIGTASWEPESSTVRHGALLANADQALYAAKAEGKDRTVSYERSIAPRDLFETAIVRGLTGGEFELYYQPVIDLGTGDVAGFEALIRWNRPDHGMVMPDEFIPTAEASTLICDLGRWVLREACGQLAGWGRDGLDPNGTLRMAVNASARHISQAGIVADVEAALEASGIAPDRLELELTETALVDETVADKHLARLRLLGVSVAIDDFGTGYTSIGQLPHLPVDVLKIDRSFVMTADPRQRSLVRLMIAAAHAFGLRVVAEGVEDVQTVDSLRGLGCDRAQGYLMGRPMPADRIGAWLAEWRDGAGGRAITAEAS